MVNRSEVRTKEKHRTHTFRTLEGKKNCFVY